MPRSLLAVSFVALLSMVEPSFAASMMGSGYQMTTSDALASKLINSPVFSTVALNNGAAATTTPAAGNAANGAVAPATNASAAPASSATDTNAQQIGTIRDLILDKNGKVSAVVIGIGGLLGLGEKSVAVSYDELKWAVAQDGSLRGTLDTTADALKTAPDFAYPSNGAATPAAAMTQPADTNNGMAPVKDAQVFVTKAAPANAFEIQSSQLALKQAQSADVKTFAQKMIDDHTAAAQKLQPAADAEHITVPQGLDGNGSDNLQKLQGLNGTAFDQAYITMQVSAHDDAVSLFQGFSQNGPASPLKDFATATLPTLKDHQKLIHQMAGK